MWVLNVFRKKYVSFIFLNMYNKNLWGTCISFQGLWLNEKNLMFIHNSYKKKMKYKSNTIQQIIYNR